MENAFSFVAFQREVINMIEVNSSEFDPTMEEIAIKSLRERISDIIALDEKFDCNFYLLQWLKAQNMDPERSENMIRKAFKWRQEQKQRPDFAIDLKIFLDFKAKYGWVYGLGKSGRPVVYYNVGTKDFRAAVSNYGKRTFIQLWIKYITELENLMFVYNKQKNRDTKRITYESTDEIIMILDIKGFSLRQLTRDVMKVIAISVSYAVAYFPAITGLGVFLNMNLVFKGALAAIRPFLSTPYLTLEIYGNEREWKNRVLRLVEDDEFTRMLNVRDPENVECQSLGALQS